jgi:hypothetical protein
VSLPQPTRNQARTVGRPKRLEDRRPRLGHLSSLIRRRQRPWIPRFKLGPVLCPCSLRRGLERCDRLRHRRERPSGASDGSSTYRHFRPRIVLITRIKVPAASALEGLEKKYMRCRWVPVEVCRWVDPSWVILLTKHYTRKMG